MVLNIRSHLPNKRRQTAAQLSLPNASSTQPHSRMNAAMLSNGQRELILAWLSLTLDIPQLTPAYLT